MTIRVIIAEGQPDLREQLGILLDTRSEIEVIGIADNGKKAVDLCSKLQPDVVLINAHMPFFDGFTAAELIHKQCPEVRIVILSYGPAGEDTRAMKAGANAFLHRPKTTEQIVKTIQRIYENHYL